MMSLGESYVAPITISHINSFKQRCVTSITELEEGDFFCLFYFYVCFGRGGGGLYKMNGHSQYIP